MMTRLYNILVPKFLRNFDEYLLRNYPVVWRTKAIFVLFYGLIGAVVLFTAGFFYPVDAQHLTVEPTNPIEIGYDSYNLRCAGLVSIGILYWAYRLYQLGFPFTKASDTLLTLFLYCCSFYVLFSFTTPAYRLGTIIRTGYFWMDDNDLQYLDKSGIYPYGFLLLKEDSIFSNIAIDTFFKKREELLNSKLKEEEQLFENLYTIDTSFWDKWFLGYHTNSDLELSKSYLSYSSYRRAQVYNAYMNQDSELSEMSELHELYYSSNLPESLPLSSSSYIPYFMTYNRQKTIKKLDIRFDKYKFKNTTDSIRVDINIKKNSYTLDVQVFSSHKLFQKS